MQPVVARATERDTDWIAGLWNGIIADTLVTFTTHPKSAEDVATMIETRPVFVLPDQAGFATYSPFRPGPGYAATVEHSVYLAPGAQGQGAGSTLLHHLMEHARRDGHHVMIAAISGANPGAVRFHARLGFVETARMPQVGRKAGQWLDLILMQKMLNPPDSPIRPG
ncbi:GNAT family N-acetyltransferase [Tateyamaria sp. SN6-1]|uniref:GNAT family N-acetyltransferase n=1 Tax=Tateyamaria sp. SN6-1 TaxID=3092148 RepID=UPI0039F4838F